MALTADERRQISRQNGQRSTGPKTVRGKIQSRMNSLTHGLSSQNITMFGGDAGELRARLNQWLNVYKPRTLAERALVERAVLASIQKRRCIDALHLGVRPLRTGIGAVAAILGYEELANCGSKSQRAGELSLYRRYQQMHERALHRALSTLLANRADEAAAALEAGSPDRADLAGEDDRGSRQNGYY